MKSLPVFGRRPVAAPLPAIAASVSGPPGAPAWRAAGASASTPSGVDPPVLAVHARTLAGEASFVGQGLLARPVTLDRVSGDAPSPAAVVVMVIMLPPSSATVPFSELGEVAALGGGFPLLVGLVGVLVGEVRRLGAVVVVVLGVRRRGAALVVVVMVVAVCVVKMAATVTVGGGALGGVSCNGGRDWSFTAVLH